MRIANVSVVSPIVLLLGCAVVLAVCLGVAVNRAAGQSPTTAPNSAAPSGVAVVELFTSEGCSSCPPADVALSTIIEDATRSGQPVLAIAHHVDYWDRLGWKDPFSTAAASQRQSAYARAFGSDQVYTPQMVVNGTSEFIGSDLARARLEIDAALKAQPTATVTLTTTATDVSATDANAVSVAYAVANAPAGSTLHVMLVERGLLTKVERGENRGKSLRHDNVARSETVVPLVHPEGVATLTLPPGVDRSRSTIIAFVQAPDTLRVLGASSAALK